MVDSAKNKYSISEYDPHWVGQFEILKKFLAEIFGSKALQIEHVGSTAIPGMKAKPVIDIFVIAEKMEDFLSEKEKMAAASYEWGNDFIGPNTLLFYKYGPDGEKCENIHVCEKTSPNVRRFLIKRDFLRAFPEKAKEYSDLKEKISHIHPNDYASYKVAKAPFLDQIEPEAYAWDENGRQSLK